MWEKGLDKQLTAAFINRRRPVLKPILKTFLPLLEIQDKVASEFMAHFREAGVSLPKFDRERAYMGASLLPGQDFKIPEDLLRMAGEKMLPIILALPPLKDHKEKLEKIFLTSKDKSERLFETMLTGDEEVLAELADAEALRPEILEFAADMVFSPLLRAITGIYVQEDGSFPWDAEGLWNRGYCPVCGGEPAIGWLDKATVDDKNAFLAGGGGKKHLHCFRCGANWKFRRGVCPACGKEGEGTIEILREEGVKDERLDLCAHCHTYCPTVDLRELIDRPDMDVMIFGMIHLDMVAARKNLKPLKPAFWNMF